MPRVSITMQFECRLCGVVLSDLPKALAHQRQHDIARLVNAGTQYFASDHETPTDVGFFDRALIETDNLTLDEPTLETAIATDARGEVAFDELLSVTVGYAEAVVTEQITDKNFFEAIERAPEYTKQEEDDSPLAYLDNVAESTDADNFLDNESSAKRTKREISPEQVAFEERSTYAASAIAETALMEAQSEPSTKARKRRVSNKASIKMEEMTQCAACDRAYKKCIIDNHIKTQHSNRPFSRVLLGAIPIST